MGTKYIKKTIQIGDKKTDCANAWNIAFGVDNNYLPFAYVTMLSIVKNNQNRRIFFHVFCDFVNEDDVLKLQRIKEENNLIEITCYLVDESLLQDFPQGHGWNLSIYYRAIAPIVLCGEVNKLLYLDADIVCLGDATHLFSIDVDGVVAAVVKDGTGTNTIDKRLDLLGISKDINSSYFNSGVMLINVRAYNKEKILSKFVQVIDTKREVLFFFDQDAFNIVLSRQVKYIDNKYNYQNLDKPVDNPCFVHFAGVRKPWFKNFDYYFFDEWRKVYHDSEWRNIPLKYKDNVKPSEYRYQAQYHFCKGRYFSAVTDYCRYLFRKIKG